MSAVGLPSDPEHVESRPLPSGMRYRHGGLYVRVPHRTPGHSIERGPIPSLPALRLTDVEMGMRAQQMMESLRDSSAEGRVPKARDLVRLVTESLTGSIQPLVPDCTLSELADAWYRNEYCRRPQIKGDALHRIRRAIDDIVSYAAEMAVVRASDIVPLHVEMYRNRLQDASLQRTTAVEYLWVWRQVAAYGVRHGILPTDPTQGIMAHGPLVAPIVGETVVTPYLRIDECLRAAAIIPPEDQLLLWMGRLAGISRGEVYGLHLADVDLRNGFLVIKRVGGRRHHLRDYRTGGLLLDETGEPITALEVPQVKRGSRYRLVIMPAALTELVGWYIHTYHATYDPNARLVVGIRGSNKSTSTSSGAAGRIKEALQDIGHSYPNKATHHLRGSYCSDLMWLRDSSGQPYEDWIQSRALGHAPKATGGLGEATPIYRYDQYSRDASFEELEALVDKVPQLQAQVAIAQAMNDLVLRHTTTLIPLAAVETLPDHRVAMRDAAAELGVSLTTLRRYVADGRIPSTDVRLSSGKTVRGAADR